MGFMSAPKTPAPPPAPKPVYAKPEPTPLGAQVAAAEGRRLDAARKQVAGGLDRQDTILTPARSSLASANFVGDTYAGSSLGSATV